MVPTAAMSCECPGPKQSQLIITKIKTSRQSLGNQRVGFCNGYDYVDIRG